MKNKKAKGQGMNPILVIVIIYLILGVIYHLQNPGNEWINDLLTGGFNLIKNLF